jgi:hypothetical protein
MRYPGEDTAAKQERIVKEASPRFAAVTWTCSWVTGEVKSDGWEFLRDSPAGLRAAEEIAGSRASAALPGLSQIGTARVPRHPE